MSLMLGMIVALISCVLESLAVVTRYILIIVFTWDSKRGVGIVQMYRPCKYFI